MSQAPPITIKYEHALAYAGSEGWHEGRTVFVQLFDSMVSSGLLAELTGNAFKVLSALGLAASPLGLGSEQAEAFFQDLVAAGIVFPQDRGRLFCCVLHDELVRRTGVSKNTLSRCTAELEDQGMVEKRVIRKEDGTRYNIFFILPGSHLDKYNTHRPRTQAPTSEPVPIFGTGSEEKPLPKTGTVPEIGTNFRSSTATTPTPTATALAVRSGFDRQEVLAHFAERKGVARYRPTAHDEKKLALLQEGGYSQEEILAAIDLAFDTHPADAEPIRMFSYCATIALATPPRRLSATESNPGSAVEPDGDPVSPPPAAAGEKPNTPTVLQHAICLYESEIGAVTPLIERELRTLTATYPEPSAWDTAFREAIRANVRRLSYVHQVLKRRATEPSPNLPPSGGGTDVKRNSNTRQSQRGSRRNGGSRRRTAPTRRRGGPGDRELQTAQQRAAEMQPLDLAATLGTSDA
jgi:hypothetical protein